MTISRRLVTYPGRPGREKWGQWLRHSEEEEGRAGWTQAVGASTFTTDALAKDSQSLSSGPQVSFLTLSLDAQLPSRPPNSSLFCSWSYLSRWCFGQGVREDAFRCMGLQLCRLTGYMNLMACFESALASPLRAVQ